MGTRRLPRAVDDLPKNCPCGGMPRWFSREMMTPMGMLNLSRGHVGQCDAVAKLPAVFYERHLAQPPQGFSVFQTAQSLPRERGREWLC